ncbi:MAG: hypothetical protein ABFE08_16330 [Armatimonadia bacterium]
MGQLLILTSCRSRKGQCATAHDLAEACAWAGLRTILLDLTPRPPRSRQRGRAGTCDLPSLLTALADGVADVSQMTASSAVPGLSALTVRPSPTDDADGTDVVAELLTRLIERLLADHDRVVVASPPRLAGLQATRILVVPSRAGRCDVIGDIIKPLKAVGLPPDRGVAGAPDLLVVTLVPDLVRRHMPEEVTPQSAGPGDEVGRASAIQDPQDVVPRLYYLSSEAIGSLRVFSRTLSERTGRHIRLSEIVAVAIRTSPVLDHAELLGRRGASQARTFALRRSSITHITQLSLLGSRALGRHIRLSDVVDLAIHLFFALPLERQVQLLQANRRKREHRA